MFCDADDMFYNACGMYIIFREIENGGFDSLVSAFIEESREYGTKNLMYINHDMDTTFVHGKVHRRKFLLDNNIRWNDNLTIHEDSYFNCLCQRLAKELKYSQTSFCLWRWRDASVCRHDPKYILKTYNNMLDSNDALVTQFLDRGRKDDAMFYSTSMIYDAYFTMNKDEWLNQENKEYRAGDVNTAGWSAYDPSYSNHTLTFGTYMVLTIPDTTDMGRRTTFHTDMLDLKNAKTLSITMKNTNNVTIGIASAYSTSTTWKTSRSASAQSDFTTHTFDVSAIDSGMVALRFEVNAYKTGLTATFESVYLT